MKIDLCPKTYAYVPTLVLLGLCIYSNTFHVPFHFDDLVNIVNNPAIRDFSYFREPSRIFALSGLSPNVQLSFFTRILGFFSFALNYRLGGFDVTGYHLVNTATHLLNGLLVYALFAITLRTPYFSTPHRANMKPDHEWIAFCGALLFVCHPLQTQAVTYIVQRFTSLATFFFLLAAVFHVRSRLSGAKKEKIYLYAAAVFSALCAMVTKEISFTLPIVILLYECMFLDGKPIKKLAWSVPYAMTMCVIPMAIFFASPRPGSTSLLKSMSRMAVSEGISRSDYLITQFAVVLHYMGLLLFPVNQNIDHDFPLTHSFGVPSVISLIVIVLLIAVALYIWYRSGRPQITLYPELRLFSFGILWFFITLSAESSIIPIADPMFEHRVYLPSVGFIVAVVALLFYVRRRFWSGVPFASKAMAAFFILSVVVLSCATYVRNGVWSDEIRLWEDAARKSPLKARTHDYLGTLYGEKGRFGDSVRELEIAARLNPDDFLIRNNLGTSYLNLGKKNEALAQFRISAMLNPDYKFSHINLGVLYLQKGLIDGALGEFRTAVRLDPSDDNAVRLLEIAGASKGGKPEKTTKGGGS